MVTVPSSARNTVGRSEAGSPWTIEPPIVPRLRTCWSAMSDAALETAPRPALPWRPAGGGVFWGVRVGGHRPDPPLAVLALRAAEPADLAQVDEHRRRREAQLHERQERVAAGEDLGVLAALGQRPERVLERLRRGVLELGRDHCAPPSVGLVGPEPAEPPPCSSSERPCSVLRGPPASWMACQTRIGVSGMSMKLTPSGRMASMTAFVTAAVAAIVPASPTPLTPSVFVGDGG